MSSSYPSLDNGSDVNRFHQINVPKFHIPAPSNPLVFPQLIVLHPVWSECPRRISPLSCLLPTWHKKKKKKTLSISTSSFPLNSFKVQRSYSKILPEAVALQLQLFKTKLAVTAIPSSVRQNLLVLESVSSHYGPTPSFTQDATFAHVSTSPFFVSYQMCNNFKCANFATANQPREVRGHDRK